MIRAHSHLVQQGQHCSLHGGHLALEASLCQEYHYLPGRAQVAGYAGHSILPEDSVGGALLVQVVIMQFMMLAHGAPKILVQPPDAGIDARSTAYEWKGHMKLVDAGLRGYAINMSWHSVLAPVPVLSLAGDL